MRTSPFLRCAELALLAALSAASMAAAQDPAKAGTPTIRATSRIVYVDVVVRNSAGKIVHGLQQDDFQLFEDKQPQKVSFFEAYTGRPKDELNAANAAETGLLSNVVSGAQNSSLNMVLLDLIDTTPQDQAYARKRMVEFLRKLPPRQQVALFVLGNKLRMVQGFSTDSEALVKAAESINIEELNRLRPVSRQLADNDAAAYEDLGATRGIGSGAFLQHALGTEDIQNIKPRLDDVAGAFREIARAVGGYPGRKNLFWLAGQFPSTDYFRLGSLAAPLLSQLPGALGEGTLNELIGSNASSAPGRALDAFQERADTAVADAQIAVYPVSLVGVQTDFVGASSNGYGSVATSPANAPNSNASDTAQYFFNERQTNRAVMESIAEKTGGEAFYGNNDPAQMLQRGFEDAGNYYELAYQPRNHNWNGQLRTIKVTMHGSGYQLSYRKGYYALPEQPAANALANFASAMRIETPPATQLVIRATPPAAANGTLQMRVNLDPNGIGFTTSDAGDRRAKLQVMMIAYPIGTDGALAQKNNLLNLGLTSEDFKAMRASGVPFQQALALKPGRYAVRIGILDLGSGRVGTLTMPFTMPAS